MQQTYEHQSTLQDLQVLLSITNTDIVNIFQFYIMNILGCKR